ncbi:hypothetical protein KDL01_38625, partial [Actinospica durhamensis]
MSSRGWTGKRVLWFLRGQVEDLQSLLWRAVALFRVFSCGYAAMLTYHYARTYTRPDLGYAVIAVMGGWTLVSIVAYAHPRGRTAAVLGADLLVTFCCLLATRWVVPAGGNPEILPMLWVAGPALAWGI